MTTALPAHLDGQAALAHDVEGEPLVQLVKVHDGPVDGHVPGHRVEKGVHVGVEDEVHQLQLSGAGCKLANSIQFNNPARQDGGK